MSFSPEFVAIMQEKMSKKELFDVHKAIKNYTKKVSSKQDLEKQLGYLLRAYEMLYNKLNKMIHKDAKPLILDKTKLQTLPRGELYGIHMCFRKALPFPNTKQQTINNIIQFAKQIHYFLTY